MSYVFVKKQALRAAFEPARGGSSFASAHYRVSCGKLASQEAAALKMITDMERIGDHAVDVADLVLNVPDKKNSKAFMTTLKSIKNLQTLQKL